MVYAKSWGRRISDEEQQTMFLRHLVVYCFALVSLLLTMVHFATIATAQDTERIELILGDLNQAQAFDLALDQIGIVPAPGSEEKATAGAVRRLGAEVSGEFPGNFTVLSLGTQRSQGELSKIAAELTESDENILNAGLVLYTVDTKTPLVVPNEIIVQFDESLDAGEARARVEALGLEPAMQNPGLGAQWLMRQREAGERSVFDVSRALSGMSGVEFAHPNMFPVTQYRQPNDTLFAEQWHHDNTGQGGGTPDADVDTLQAWDLTQGNPDVSIALIDNGFDINHPDINDNIWTNAGELGGTAGVDDDNNGYVDDVNGYSFVGCTVATGANCGSGVVAGLNHGTAVAGVAAARGNNNLGVIGSCPNCSIIPLRRGSGYFADALAIAYPSLPLVNADILTNSWGYQAGTPVALNVAAAIQATANSGTTIFWAMSNSNKNDCTGTPDISANPNVIAISAISNEDRKVTESGFGNCMELLASTFRGWGPNPNGQPPGSGAAFTGTLNVTTTDLPGTAGYNNTTLISAAPGVDPTYCPAEVGDTDYTSCFVGTSAAAPLAAGIAGLVLSADSALAREEVQRILQDTADKPEDSIAAYDQVTGKSSPPGGASKHGYGRINAFEAVRLVASPDVGGRGGHDIFIRDNRLDWGNTEQPTNVLMEPTRGFIPHYRSVDIKVDAPPFQVSPTNSAAFDLFAHENPESGEINKVYVRVHNRGHRSVADVTVKLHWVFAGTALPALPGDFWTQFPSDSTDPANPWNAIGTQTLANLEYSGASVAGTGFDNSAILSFDWMGPALDPSRDAFRHHCLFVVMSAPDDPVSANSMGLFVPDLITPSDNNVTHRNVSVEGDASDGMFDGGFIVRNPFPDKQITTRLVVYHAPELNVALSDFDNKEIFEMDPGKEIPVKVTITSQDKISGTVDIVQEILNPEEYVFVPLGGFAFDFHD